MKNYLESGDTFSYTVGSGTTIASGDFVIVGEGLLGVAQDALVGDGASQITVKREGVYKLPKATSQVWAQGDRLFWDSNAKNFTTDPTKTPVPAVAFVAALSADATGQVLLSERGGLKIAAGQATTASASDTIVTGLAKLIGVVATEDSDPVDDPEWVSASIGDQNGSPAAGSFLLKTWKNTSGTDPTPVAASTFSKKVNWVAFGI